MVKFNYESTSTDMQEKAKARLRELAPARPDGARGRESRNLALAFSCMSVLLTMGSSQPLCYVRRDTLASSIIMQSPVAMITLSCRRRRRDC